MAGTYYDWKERDNTKIIDWSKVGSDFTKMLNDESDNRQKKKDTLDELSTEYIKKSMDNPQGDSDNLNIWAQDFGSDASEFMLDLNKQLKAGKIHPREYTKSVQRISDGTDSLFLMLKEYQTMAGKHRERIDKGESAALELYSQMEIEKFGNFSESKAIIAPDGGLSVGFYKKDDQGNIVIDGGPNKVLGVNNMRMGVNSLYNSFKEKQSIQEFVTSLGDNEVVIRDKKGSLVEWKTITDATLREAVSDGSIDASEIEKLTMFNKLFDAHFETVSSNPINVSEILMKTMSSEEYDFTHDPNNKDPKLILLKVENGRNVPMPTKEQVDIARETMRTIAIGAVDRKVKIERMDIYHREEEWAANRKDKKKNVSNDVSMLSSLYRASTQGSVDSAVTYFGTKDGSVSFERTSDNSVLINSTKGTWAIDFTQMNESEFIRSIGGLLGSGTVGEIDNAIKSGGYGSGGMGSIGAVSNNTKPPASNVTPLTSDQIADNLRTDNQAFEDLYKSTFPSDTKGWTKDNYASALEAVQITNDAYTIVDNGNKGFDITLSGGKKINSLSAGFGVSLRNEAKNYKKRQGGAKSFNKSKE